MDILIEFTCYYCEHVFKKDISGFDWEHNTVEEMCPMCTAPLYSDDGEVA